MCEHRITACSARVRRKDVRRRKRIPCVSHLRSLHVCQATVGTIVFSGGEELKCQTGDRLTLTDVFIVVISTCIRCQDSNPSYPTIASCHTLAVRYGPIITALNNIYSESGFVKFLRSLEVTSKLWAPDG